MMLRRKLLWAVLIAQTLSLALIVTSMIWDGSIESGIYSTIQWLRTDPNSQYIDNWVRLGRWLILWWLFAALAVQLGAWLTTLVLAASETQAKLLERVIWCIAIFFAWFPAAILYCVLKLRPNNSFKPNPQRGGA